MTEDENDPKELLESLGYTVLSQLEFDQLKRGEIKLEAAVYTARSPKLGKSRLAQRLKDQKN